MSESKNPNEAEAPRSLIFHWAANMVFASIALLAGILFGERIPKERFGLLFALVALVAMLLVPLTRSWEKIGIERRRKRERPPGN